ncbi:hypothetical protein VFPFJ_10400 [Purpureocillium lilacinum]|uniref:Uncharacterized protein n=2 Tax=Purpureocillium lilacinum TaxID=33203 RepID=A0A179GLP0_PURLI|nr:hypothetical protein VFPFJ_10400 [Purpureocillium lilacinum]OAQ76863.1 hypothetical protein VFPFJ_10400 [Purpureocillium lilacinum]OAQ78271.1 hypothetical protein VFPBJ_06390 [Purpureocillium lilacinum]
MPASSSQHLVLCVQLARFQFFFAVIQRHGVADNGAATCKSNRQFMPLATPSASAMHSAPVSPMGTVLAKERQSIATWRLLQLVPGPVPVQARAGAASAAPNPEPLTRLSLEDIVHGVGGRRRDRIDGVSNLSAVCLRVLPNERGGYDNHCGRLGQRCRPKQDRVEAVRR